MHLFKYLLTVISISVVPSLAAPAPSAQAPDAAPTSNVNQVVDALNTISNQLTTLQTKVSNFNGGILDVGQLLDIQIQSSVLGSDINDATKTINQNPTVYTQADSLTISAAVLNFVPSINSTLVTLIDKKNVFDHSVLELISVSWLVYIDIKNLHQDTIALSTALQSKLDPILIEAINQVVAEINQWFTNAENVYKNSGLFGKRSFAGEANNQ